MSIPTQYGSVQLSDYLALQPGDVAYQAGWISATQVAASITPSAAGVADYAAYSQLVWKNYKTAAINGFPSDFNDGYNNCLEMAGLYEYYNDPLSPHNKAS